MQLKQLIFGSEIHMIKCIRWTEKDSHGRGTKSVVWPNLNYLLVV